MLVASVVDLGVGAGRRGPAERGDVDGVPARPAGLHDRRGPGHGPGAGAVHPGRQPPRRAVRRSARRLRPHRPGRPGRGVLARRGHVRHGGRPRAAAAARGARARPARRAGPAAAGGRRAPPAPAGARLARQRRRRHRGGAGPAHRASCRCGRSRSGSTRPRPRCCSASPGWSTCCCSTRPGWSWTGGAGPGSPCRWSARSPLGLLLLPLTDGFGTVLAVAVLMAVGNGMGAGVVMTLGADVAPVEGRSQFLGGWRLAGDVGATGGPLLVSAVAWAAPLAVACLVTGGLAVLGTGWVARQVSRAERRRRPVRGHRREVAVGHRALQRGGQPARRPGPAATPGARRPTPCRGRCRPRPGSRGSARRPPRGGRAGRGR